MKYFLEIPTNAIPTFSDLKQKPKDIYEGGWIIFVMLFLFGLYISKDLISSVVQQNNERSKVALEEKKAQLKEREEMIDFMQDQINRLQNERAILKSITGVDSNFLKGKTENATQVSARENN